MVDQTVPYLPDILREVASSVNDITTAFAPGDSFTIGFDHGIYSQVGKDIYDKAKPDVLVWLLIGNNNDRGRNYAIFSEVRCDLIIYTKTDNKYSQIERDNISYKPKLLPAYDLFIKQLNLNKGILPVGNSRRHSFRLAPYWGGGDVGGQDTKNLFKNFVDAIEIKNLELKLKYFNNCP